MLFSIAIILLTGLIFGTLFNKLKLPPLFGMIIAGIIIGPYALNILDNSILSISADLRKIALVIILARAGLSLNISDLKKVGRPAILLCFLPASFEIIGFVLLAPLLLGLSLLDSAILGCVIAAVSPAVVVPRMLKLNEQGYGTRKGIPQMIMAGASVDDIFVIVLFSAFLSVSGGKSITPSHFLNIPISIVLGIIIGLITGQLLTILFHKINMRASIKVIFLLSTSFLLIGLETALENVISFSSLLAIMASGVIIYRKSPKSAIELSDKFSKLWIAAEIFLFVLVGTTVNLQFAVIAGISAIILIFATLLFRMLGTYLCLLNTPLTFRERVFCLLAYMPKATVQAAIGAIPLSMGLPCGQTILTVAVLSILISAPLGAFCIDVSYKKLLNQ